MKMGKWRIAMVYGGRELAYRRILWDNLEEFCSNSNPVIVGGDFNYILANEDKRGGRPFRFSQGAREMSSFLARCDLHEANIVGPIFTWCNNKNGNARILERFDRCYVNPIVLHFNRILVRHLTRVASDHCPIILNFLDANFAAYKIIRFEKVWASYPDSIGIVKATWSKKINGDYAHVLNLKF
ncbi:uncharacterized protein LOC110106964 [Dendrobium catenatum]|uniref:uncharacterized protein LOC110106964 n=1 Tax=Dendrobium catenatum TaxID=906689 RepID=UPI0009F27875|nr:uncharacterized protein LOC110106964 [Dendrobium catenatum]